MKKTLTILAVISLSLLVKTADAQLYINEVMSNNLSTVLDEDQEYSDWVEIYNAGSSSVSLNGYYLSDNPDTLNKWRFPSVSISARSFKTVWCSGKNRTGSILHTNFSLGKNGESIILTASNGTTIVDYVTISPLPADKSFGRLPNGGNLLSYLSDPTYNASNNAVTALNGTINTLPVFSIPGGIYTTAQSISLSHPDPTVQIRYTLDGSEPTIYSNLYTGPFTVQSRVNDPNYYSMIRTGWANHSYIPDWQPPVGNVFKVNVVRARAFKTGLLPGPIQTNTYFIDPNMRTRYGSLPLVSLVSDPKHLFNDTTGIYVPGLTYLVDSSHGNYHNGWKKPANIEIYYPDGRQLINGNFEISVGGETSQSSPQKGLNVSASTNYGPSKIDYPIFENTTGRAKYIQQFDGMKIRAWGTDRRKGLLHDGYCNSFMTKTDLDYAAFQLCVLFIDGEYWGLQELREANRDNDYYQEHYYVDKNNPGFDMINGDGNNFYEGDAVHWDAMWNYISTHSMSDSSDFAYVKTQMDVENFGRYCMFSIFFARGDWPNQNEAKWRPRTPDGRWKWIQWDMDNSISNSLMPWGDMFEQVLTGTPSYGPSPLLVKLLENTQYRAWFLNLHADWMNTEFQQILTLARLDAMANQMRPYMSEFQDRYQLNYTWENRIDSMDFFLARRQKYVRRHIMEHFGFPDTSNIILNVSDTTKGNIQINTLFLDRNIARITANVYPWTGVYFDSLPVKLQAIPKPGYIFRYWMPGRRTNPNLTVTLRGDSSLTAYFDPDPNYHPILPLVINEVMSSNSSTIADNNGEYDDWIELYNPNNDTIDVAGYYLASNLVMPNRFKIRTAGDSTKIEPHGHLLIWMDDDTEQGALHASFKFNSSGDFVALVAPDGLSIVDSLSFESLPANVSYGRRYDGAARFINFPISTPRATNWKYTNETVFINEVQTSNTTTISDNYGQHEPWVELFNPNADTIDLAGWILNHGNQQFTFRYDNDSTLIFPGEHKLLWADNQSTQGALHLTYRLAATGCISLAKPNNTVSDSLCYGIIPADHSFGRSTDGAGTLIEFTTPTPADTNEAPLLYTARLLINELQANNQTTVADNFGQFDPWIEIYNPENDTVDLSGWKITHNLLPGQQFVIPQATAEARIAPRGHLLLWADQQLFQGALHLNFTLPAAGQVSLLKPDQSLSDELTYTSLPTDQATGRRTDGDSVIVHFPLPTPGTMNWMATRAEIIINEVQTLNSTTVADNYNQYDPWIELYNPSSDTVDLSGWIITHSRIPGQQFVLPYGNDSTKVGPAGHLLLWCDHQLTQGVLHLDFTLPADGQISLLKPNEVVSDRLDYAAMAVDHAVGCRTDGDSVIVDFTVPTPGSMNWMVSSAVVLINELQTQNVSTYSDNFNQFDPWIELYNPSNDTIELAGWKLTHDQIPGFVHSFTYGNDSTRIAPHEHKIIWWDHQPQQGILHIGQWLPFTGCVRLERPNGGISDQACYGGLAMDHSYGRSHDGSPTWIDFTTPTPAALNWQSTAINILINELQTVNSSTIADAFGEFDQWIELYNPGADTVNLSGWELSTGAGASHRFAYDNDSLKLAPSDHLLVWADANNAQGVDHLSYLLPSNECISLHKPSTDLSDAVCYSTIGTDLSYGRSSDGNPTWVVFTTPTPDSTNAQLGTGIAFLHSSERLRLFPNPVDGDHVNFNKNINLTLYDELGEAIGLFRDTRSLDVSALPAGLYLIRSDKNESIKFIRK